MKKVMILCVAAIAMMVVTGCGNKADQLQQQVDSLQTALQQRDNDYSQLNEYLTVISDGLDSIAIQENSLLTRNPEGPTPSREQMKRGLHQLKETLQQQRERITKLEKELANGQGNVKKLQSVIAALKQQIEQKDMQISDLLVQLEQSNYSIDQLTAHVGMLTRQTEDQQAQIAQQEEVMHAQDQALNEGFIKIATKKELKEMGLLSGGFLKKSKVDYSKVDRSLFQSVDTRQVTTISIPSKNPTVLSPMPADSYSLEKDGSNTTLHITDVAKFWGVSNFLIIQTN